MLIAIAFTRCKQPSLKKTDRIKKTRLAPKTTGYHFEKYKDWVKSNGPDSLQQIVLTVNRTDRSNLAKMDSIIVPNDVSGDREFYLPFPLEIPYIKDINKILFFSYATQSFGAYEMGELVYTGPSSMGRKADPTPPGLYYCNWKAEKTTSTFNDEWDLLWNFNIENKLGIGFHQYELPGYPASHSCLRLQQNDARYLYNWADQWILDEKDENIVLAKGTPVIVFGSYAFDAPKPWLQLVSDPKALDFPAAGIQQQVVPFLQDILSQQQKRDSVISGRVDG